MPSRMAFGASKLNVRLPWRGEFTVFVPHPGFMLKVDRDWLEIDISEGGVYLSVGNTWKAVYYVGFDDVYGMSYVEFWLVVSTSQFVPHTNIERWMRREKYVVRQSDMTQP